MDISGLRFNGNRRYRAKRPWKVFVRSIGPTFSFSNEADARERAKRLVSEEFVVGNHLVGNYSEVLVYKVHDEIGAPWERIVYRHDKDPVVQEMDDSGWKNKGES